MAKVPSVHERIQAVGRTRSVAAAALRSSLDRIYLGLSESTIHKRWQTALASNPALMPDGWYLPPPGGVSVLISEPPYYERTNFVSLRDQESWPYCQSRFQAEDLLYLYASPVDRRTAMIGDFQITIYSGNNRIVKNHIATCFQVTTSIVNHAAVGMELRELYEYASRLIRNSGFINLTSSRTRTRDGSNIGHTVPWSYGDYDQRIWPAIRGGQAGEVADLVSHARVFLAADETLRITDNIAFTVEPQMASPDQPKISFHIIVAFCDGVKKIYANYSELLTLFNMNDYLPAESVRALTDS